MTRWLSFFAEYNFSVKFKLGRLHVVADALSRRPDFEPAVQINSEHKATVAAIRVPSSASFDDVRRAYQEDKAPKGL